MYDKNKVEKAYIKVIEEAGRNFFERSLIDTEESLFFEVKDGEYTSLGEDFIIYRFNIIFYDEHGSKFNDKTLDLIYKETIKHFTHLMEKHNLELSLSHTNEDLQEESLKEESHNEF